MCETIDQILDDYSIQGMSQIDYIVKFESHNGKEIEQNIRNFQKSRIWLDKRFDHVDKILNFVNLENQRENDYSVQRLLFSQLGQINRIRTMRMQEENLQKQAQKSLGMSKMSISKGKKGIFGAALNLKTENSSNGPKMRPELRERMMRVFDRLVRLNRFSQKTKRPFTVE